MKFVLIVFFSIITWSCYRRQDLYLYHFLPKAEGKWYYAGTTLENDTAFFRRPSKYDVLFIDWSAFNDRARSFTLDTYLENNLVRHQIIIDAESEFDEYTGIYWRSYVDQNNDSFTHWSDENDQFIFYSDNPNYFYLKDFPVNQPGVRNYFVHFNQYP